MPASLTLSTARQGQPAVLWVIALLLAVIATVLIVRWDDRGLERGSAWAQEATGAGRLGARGIYAFSGPVTSKTYGVFMLDVDTGTIWCYELVPAMNGAKQLCLVAGRSWIFDRYLEEFNVGTPTPAQVADLVDKQMSQRQRQAGDASDNGAASTQPTGGPILGQEPGK